MPMKHQFGGPEPDNYPMHERIARERAVKIGSAKARGNEYDHLAAALGLKNPTGHDIIKAALEEVQHLRAILRLTEFGFNFARCPVCAGFDGKGENDGVHNKTC